MNPCCSVVIPAYNHRGYAVEATRSALASPLVHEVLVCDDASTDGTWDALQTVVDPRLRIMRHAQNRGADATLTELLDQAQGPYLAILNSDDVFAPGRIERCVAVLQTGQFDLVGTDIQLIDAAGAVITDHWWVRAFDDLKAVWRATGDWVATLLEGNVFMTTSNIVLTRALWQRLRPFSSDRYVHDYDFLLRAVAAGAHLAWIDEPLLAYRLHGTNTISENPLNANREAAALLRRHLAALLAMPGPLSTRVAHLNSQWARIEGYEVQILRDWAQQEQQRWQHILAERDQQLAQSARALAERDRAIRRLQIAARANAWRAQAARAAERGATRTILRALRALRSHWWLARALRADAALLRVSGFAALRRLVMQHRACVQAISVDIFDTLVARCIEPPQAVVARVAQRLAEHLGLSEHADYVLHLRHEAEQTLRRAAQAAGHDHECHHDELARAWVSQLLPDADETERDALIQWVEQTELALERLALQPKPQARLFLQWAKSQGLRVLAISDMYLGQRHLQQLLDTLGYGGLIDAIYVSSEHRVGKYSTRLFQHVLQCEGLVPSAVLHVGDNLFADAVAPAQLGMTGVFLDERHERRRRREQTLCAHMAARAGVWPGRMMAEIVAQRLRADARARRNDPYFQYGLEVLGPIFATFMLGVLERVRADAPERLLFLARDGYLFMRMYEHATRTQPGPWPPAEYACVSRAVAAQAAVADGLNSAQAAVALYNPKQRGLWSILKTCGLDPNAFVDLARQHGLDPIDAPIANADDARLQAFLRDDAVQARIRPCGEQAREHLRRYFAQLGFFSSARVALVDIGWNATIQRFLERAFGAQPNFPWVDGYYLAYVHAIHQEELARGAIHGLLFDRRRGNAHERAPLDFEELFEQAARAPHGTTVGYRATDQRVEPVFKDDAAPDRQAELRCNPWIASLQEGVLLCWEHWLAARMLTGADFAAVKPYAMALAERAVAYPTAEEVGLITRLAHTEDFGHDHVLALAPGPVRWWHWLYPVHLRRQLAGSAWPFAMFAKLPTHLPAAIGRCLHLRMLRSRHKL